jgi:hypothetical protein
VFLFCFATQTVTVASSASPRATAPAPGAGAPGLGFDGLLFGHRGLYHSVAAFSTAMVDGNAGEIPHRPAGLPQHACSSWISVYYADSQFMIDVGLSVGLSAHFFV